MNPEFSSVALEFNKSRFSIVHSVPFTIILPVLFHVPVIPFWFLDKFSEMFFRIDFFLFYMTGWSRFIHKVLPYWNTHLLKVCIVYYLSKYVLHVDQTELFCNLWRVFPPVFLSGWVISSLFSTHLHLKQNFFSKDTLTWELCRQETSDNVCTSSLPDFCF